MSEPQQNKAETHDKTVEIPKEDATVASNHQSSLAQMPNNKINQPEIQTSIQKQFSKIKCTFLILGILILITGLIITGVLLNNFFSNAIQIKVLTRHSQPITGSGQQITESQLEVSEKSLLHQETKSNAKALIVQAASTSRLALETQAVSNYAVIERVDDSTGSALKFFSQTEAILIIIPQLIVKYYHQVNPENAARLLAFIQLNQRHLQAENQTKDENPQNFQKQIQKLYASSNGLQINRTTVNNYTYYHVNSTQDGFIIQKEELTPSRLLKSINQNRILTQEFKESIINYIINQVLKKFIEQSYEFIKRYGAKISKQLNLDFNQGVDVIMGSEQRQYFGQNNKHVLITTKYKSVLANPPSQINKTKILQSSTLEVILKCHSYKEGKLCSSDLFQGYNSLLKIADNPQTQFFTKKKYQAWRYNEISKNSEENGKGNNNLNTNQNLQMTPSFSSSSFQSNNEEEDDDYTPLSETNSGDYHQSSISSEDNTKLYLTQTDSHSHQASPSNHDTESNQNQNFNHEHSTSNTDNSHQAKTISHTHDSNSNPKNANSQSSESSQKQNQKDSNNNAFQHDHSEYKKNTQSASTSNQNIADSSSTENSKSNSLQETTSQTNSQQQKTSQTSNDSKENSESSKKQQTSSEDSKQQDNSQKSDQSTKSDLQNQPLQEQEQKKKNSDDTPNSQIPKL